MADDLGFVIEALDGAVTDGHMKPCKDVFFMASNHPGKLA